MKNARISSEKIGALTYYYPEIEGKHLWFFKTWYPLGYVFLSCGRVHWGKQLSNFSNALELLRDYETLYGEKLNILTTTPA